LTIIICVSVILIAVVTINDFMTFKLFVIRQSRVLFAILLIVLTFLFSISLVPLIDELVFKILVPLILISITASITIYSTFSNLFVKIEDNEIEFRWARKLIFPLTSVSKINLEQIKYLVIDKDPSYGIEFLRSIKTENIKISLGIGKINRNDADAFISYLKQHTNAQVVDSWDTTKQYGFVTFAYYVTTLMLIAAPLGFLYLLISGQLYRTEIQHWLGLFGAYSFIIPSWITLKNKYRS